eukprot:GHUV01046135.1.p1 GENE.GHUV01046135.1~~GHUV01046135.1.p1  ORF type:complete len:112 (-),score=22.51 GHUV01046135.1:196-531(-)
MRTCGHANMNSLCNKAQPRSYLMLIACIAAISPGIDRPAEPVRLQSCHASPGLLRSSKRPATAPLLAAVMPSDERGTRRSDRVVLMVEVKSLWLLKKGRRSNCRSIMTEAV